MSNYIIIEIIVICIVVGQHALNGNADLATQASQQNSYGLELAEDQCKIVPIVHLIQYPGCRPQTIASFACRGYCSSYVQVGYSSSMITFNYYSAVSMEQSGSKRWYSLDGQKRMPENSENQYLS